MARLPGAVIHPWPISGQLVEGACLAIGLPGPIALSLAQDRPLVTMSLADLCAKTVLSPPPGLVVCPLVARWGDAPDVMACLLALEYRGALIVVAHQLPDCTLVERELKRKAKGLTVSLLCL